MSFNNMPEQNTGSIAIEVTVMTQPLQMLGSARNLF